MNRNEGKSSVTFLGSNISIVNGQSIFDIIWKMIFKKMLFQYMSQRYLYSFCSAKVDQDFLFFRDLQVSNSEYKSKYVSSIIYPN